MSRLLSKHTKTKLEKLLDSVGDLALKRRARKIVVELNPKDGEKILDVGCGNGYYLFLLSNLGLNIKLTGVDNDKRALKDAKVFLKGKKVTLRYGNLMKKLPFKTGIFDKLVMSEVLEHLPDDRKGLLEIKRVLKKDGILIITVPNKRYPPLWDPINWVLEHITGKHIKSGFFAGIWNQHDRLYKIEDLNKLVKQTGFNLHKIEPVTFWSLPFNHYIINLGARLLAHNRKSKILSGSDKFDTQNNKSLISKIFFGISNAIDILNDFYSPRTQGVSILVKASK